MVDNNTGQSFRKTYTFSISKKGVPVTTLSASPQAQSVTSGSGGIGTPTNVTITVNEGGDDYTYTTGTVTANKFKITGVTNGTNNNNGTVTPTTPTNSTAIEGGVTASYTNSEGTEFTGKKIPFSVGVTGLGDTGPQGPQGSQGDAGPGLTYVGECSDLSSGYTWQSDGTARQVTSVSGTYYVTKDAADGQTKSTTGCPPNTTYFEQMTSFASVATDILLAQDATITRNLTIGTQGSNIGTLRSANATSISSGTGFFVSASGDFRVGSPSANNIRWYQDSGEFEISGSVAADTGSIAGFLIKNHQLIGGQNDLMTNAGIPYVTLDSGVGANWEYDGSDTVSGLFIGGITGSLGTNFTHGTYDNANFTGSDFTGSAIAVADVNGDESVYVRLGNRNTYMKITSQGSNAEGILLISSSNFNVAPGGAVSATNFNMISGSISISGSTANANIGADGTLTAANANINGTITANSGIIGGFTIASSSLTSTPTAGTAFAKLSAGDTPSLVLFESAETESVKITSDANLTNIDIGSSPPDISSNSYTSVSGGSSASTFSNFLSSLSTNATNSTTTIPSSSLRIPSTGTIGSDYDGITATITGNFAHQQPGGLLDYYVNATAEAYASSVSYVSAQTDLFISVHKGNSSSTQMDIDEFQVSVFNAGGGTIENIEDSVSSRAFTLSFDLEEGFAYFFKVGIKNSSASCQFTGNGGSLDATFKKPDIGSIALSVRGGTSTPPFSELTRGGLQVVGNAAAGSDKRAVQIPASDAGDTLRVTGSIGCTGDITAFSTSDIRLKENIISIPNPIDKIKQVKGVEFNWKPGFEKVHNFGTGSDIGVIAQDIEKVLPQITRINEFNNYLGVQYDKLTPLLVEAIKELNKKIEELESKLKDKE